MTVSLLCKVYRYMYSIDAGTYIYLHFISTHTKKFGVLPLHLSGVYFCSYMVTMLCLHAIEYCFSLQAIQDKYSRLHAISGPGFKVQFEDNTISLIIPEDGICLKNGWTITPLVPPVVSLHCCYYWF